MKCCGGIVLGREDRDYFVHLKKYQGKKDMIIPYSLDLIRKRTKENSNYSIIDLISEVNLKLYEDSRQRLDNDDEDLLAMDILDLPVGFVFPFTGEDWDDFFAPVAEI